MMLCPDDFFVLFQKVKYWLCSFSQFRDESIVVVYTPKICRTSFWFFGGLSLRIFSHFSREGRIPFLDNSCSSHSRHCDSNTVLSVLIVTFFFRRRFNTPSSLSLRTSLLLRLLEYRLNSKVRLLFLQECLKQLSGKHLEHFSHPKGIRVYLKVPTWVTTVVNA